jgi:hypothetical protein
MSLIIKLAPKCPLTHRVRFAGAGLAVGENAHVVSDNGAEMGGKGMTNTRRRHGPAFRHLKPVENTKIPFAICQRKTNVFVDALLTREFGTFAVE